jgi:hypothetical protein
MSHREGMQKHDVSTRGTQSTPKIVLSSLGGFCGLGVGPRFLAGQSTMRNDPHRTRRLIAALGLLAAASACGDVARAGRSPVYLVIDSLQAASGNKPTTLGNPLISDVITNVITPAPCSANAPCPTVFNDVGSVVLHLAPKDVSVAPTTNNQVTITRYHVNYKRADGRNTPGTDVPYGFDGGISGTVPPAGTATFGFELVRSVAKSEAPLVQLVSNFGVLINVIADVTFYGTDQVGNDVTATGSISIEFGNFGDQ